ncbi:hypothetical protein [Brevundimonas aveniformis]|uniref:hypothetical protein n=1 Tax=Brevundimonas aveniformis TaxID=370977 RepID=UPI00041C6911|nr:hypothetical protein [Brevundimonas aveniformis]
MSIRLAGLLVFSAALVACAPDASSQYPDGTEPEAAPLDPAATDSVAGPAAPELNNEVSATDPIRLATIGPANTTLSEQVGQSVAINPEIFRSEGDWVFIYGPVRNIDGTSIDWGTTNMAQAAADGMMDGDLGIVLLNWHDGDWRVVEAVIGPTDVPQGGWPAEHHVSPALVGMEGG